MMAASVIRCPKCEELLCEPSPDNPCFQCNNCSTYLNENYAFHQEPEVLDQSHEAVEEGVRRTDSGFSTEHDSFSNSSDESNQLGFVFGTETPFGVKPDSAPLYRKRHQPKQMRTAHVMHKPSTASDKPLYSPRSQEKEDTSSLEKSYDLMGNTDQFAFNPSQILPYHKAATRQRLRLKSEPNHRSNKKLDDVRTTVSQGDQSNTSISSKICDSMEQEEAASVMLQPLSSPNQQVPAYNHVTNSLNSLFLDEDQSRRNEDRDTMTKEEDPLALRAKTSRGHLRKTSKSQTADDSQQDNSSAEAEKKSIVDLKNKLRSEDGMPNLPSNSGSKSFFAKIFRGNRQGSEVDLWDPDVAAFTMSQELNPTRFCETNKWSFDPQDLWPVPSSSTVLEPVIESNEPASPIAAPEQQSCVQQASAMPTNHLLIDPQTMWLLEKLRLSAAENLLCSTEPKPPPYSLSQSFNSSLSFMEKPSGDLGKGESFDLQQSEPQLQRDLNGTLEELKEKAYPALPSMDDPPYVRCQHCPAVLTVPQVLFPCKKTVQKLRCGGCWKVSIFSVLQLTAGNDPYMHDTDPDPTNAYVPTSADTEKSANDLTHSQEIILPREEGVAGFIDPINPNSEDPSIGVNFVEIQLPMSIIESGRERGSCESVNLDHKEIPKARDTISMHSFEFCVSSSTKILPGEDPESDIEFTSNSSEKEVQDKFQISTSLEKKIRFSLKPSTSSSSGSSFSDEFLTNTDRLAKALASSGTRFSAMGPDNFFSPHKKNDENPDNLFFNSHEKNYEGPDNLIFSSHEKNYGKIYEMIYGKNYEKGHEKNYEKNYGKNEKNYERDHEKNYGKNQEKNYGKNHEMNHKKNHQKNSAASLQSLMHSPGSPDFSFTKFSGALSFSAGSALWGSPLSDLYDRGLILHALKETQASRDDREGGAGRGLTKSLKGLLKRSTKTKTRRHHEHQGGFSREVYINDELIPDSYVKEAEHLAGPIHSGSYWYDIYAGFWGVSGGPCMGIISPGIEQFDHPLSRNCSSGNTEILVNGRELHKLDLKKLGQRGLPSTRGRAYKIFIDGRVFEESSGVEGQGLGKLAPTVEKRGCGYGMLMSIA
ncbi:hypothetical protein O6H91_Y421400 [Diphasiastrum complanatum]|nr:hypothetical protein O6H91_Y421400 [Diphasiastrum complanatum]KAJ7250557.1 hypothetical protein O6H91_Y421400 [Diphasiastrum complanatum]KAJ7250558.1 hypothetical protein O6H91_Y421400 [Diphasiastrum complanatum]